MKNQINIKAEYSKVKEYIKQAREWYAKSIPNYIPDSDDIIECTIDFMEEDLGAEINFDFTALRKLRKLVEGREE